MPGSKSSKIARGTYLPPDERDTATKERKNLNRDFYEMQLEGIRECLFLLLNVYYIRECFIQNDNAME